MNFYSLKKKLEVSNLKNKTLFGFRKKAVPLELLNLKEENWHNDYPHGIQAHNPDERFPQGKVLTIDDYIDPKTNKPHYNKERF